MAKSKKKHKPQQKRTQQNKPTDNHQNDRNAPNNGRNRAEKRAQSQRPVPQKSSKSTALRVLILAIMFVLLLGMILLPLLK